MDSFIANTAIIVSLLTLLAAAGLTAYSVSRSMRLNKRSTEENGVPKRNITIGTVALLLIVALPSLVFGSVTDMCIITSLVLLTVAAALVIYGRVQTLKRVRKRQ